MLQKVTPISSPNKMWNRRLEDWLTDLAILVFTLTSAVATYSGTIRLVNGRPWVACAFTAAIQGGMLALAQAAQRSEVRRSRALWTVAWAAATFFSIYTSALGILELQRDSIEGDQAHQTMERNWAESADRLRNFYIDARAWVADSQLANRTATRIEWAREQAARAARILYSTEERTKLAIEAAKLSQTARQLGKVQPIASKMPPSIDEARSKLDSAFAQAANLYAEMPDTFRSAHAVPAAPKEEIRSTNPQDELFAEVWSGSARGLVIAAIAILLDALPVLLLAALKPRRALPTCIREMRIAIRDLRSALFEPQPLHVEHLRVLIEPGGLIGIVSLGGDNRVIYPNDLTASFEQLERSLAEEMGSPARIVSIANAAGAEIVPDLPLLPQLDGDLLRLKVKPVEGERI